LPDDAPDAPPALDTTALAVPTPEVDAPDALETVTVDDSDAPVAPGGDSQAAVGDVSELNTPEAPAAAPDAETDTEQVSAPDEDAAPNALSGDAAPEAETEIAALPMTDAGDDTSVGSESAPAIASDITAPSAPEAPEISSESSLPQPSDTDPSVTVIEIIGDEAATRPASPDNAPLIEIIEPNPEPDVAQENAEEELPSFLRPVEILENAGEVETDRLPQVSGLSEDDGSNDAPLTEPEAGVTPEPETADEDTRVAALPTIRRPGAETEPEQTSEDESADATEESVEGEEIDPNLPALLKYASAFENPEGNPLLSIVLVNSGSALDAAQLEELPEFIAFGIEAGAAGAAQMARAYRDAGREVVMIPSLPKGATPQDVEQALRVNFETITEAVAVMDVSGGSFQADRAAVSQVVDVIATSGHGLITFPRGLNTAHQRATRAGVSTGLIFRELDGAGENGEEIQRTLDRAAFRARQDEAVILVGTTQATTLIALLEWVLGNRADSVTLAPISAALAGGG
ncbi:MAG: divergent polysaccharide deacetylase family protein, partial [Paracoccaceae bacterium]